MICLEWWACVIVLVTVIAVTAWVTWRHAWRSFLATLMSLEDKKLLCATPLAYETLGREDTSESRGDKDAQ